MKKRIFSLMAVVVFVGSSTHALDKNLEANNECAEEAFEMQNQLEMLGVHKYLANELANMFYDDCTEGNE